jgi:deoxycytidylate deaminase
MRYGMSHVRYGSDAIEDKPDAHLSRTEQHFLNLAVKQALISPCPTRHGAVLVKNGHVISVGVNILKNDPAYVTVVSALSVHAEDSVLKANRGSAAGAVLYVARVNCHGGPAMSRPCKSCQKLLSRYGVKKVIWTA